MNTLPRILLHLLAALLLAAALPACENTPKTPPQTALNPPFYVPYAALAQPLNPPPPARQLAYSRAADILPSSDQDLYYPRFEPFAYGPTAIGGISAYTDYTYDAQSISTPGNSGWHYRYVVRQGVSFP